MSLLFRIAIIMLLSIITVLPAHSQEKIVEGGNTYLLHKVKKGEGLYRLSVIYGVAQQDIINANPDIETQGLKEDSLVRIPQKKGDGKAATTAEQKRDEVVKPVASDVVNGKFIYHTVEKGETLYALSRRFNIPVADLIKYNPGSDQYLAEGSVFKIPVVDNGEVVQYKDVKQNVSADLDNSKYLLHTVAAGETLYRIALQYQVSVADITAANPFLDVNNIPQGAQIRIPKTKEPEAVESADSRFLIHKVQQGESLFSIGQKYNRLVIELRLANDNIKENNISTGQEIRIPKQPVDLLLYKHSLFISHKVKKKETLYGISKQYGADIDVVKLVNKDIDFSSLSKGDMLLVPTANWYSELFKTSDVVKVESDKIDQSTEEAATVGPCRPDTRYGTPIINVALMLPFDYATYRYVKNMPDTVRTEAHVALVAKSRSYIEFYEGALMAIDSMKKSGTSVNLYVYDSQRDSTLFSRVTLRPEFEKMNLIIGPSSINTMAPIARFAKEKRIPVVFPFSAIDGSIRNNPYVFQASPVDSLYRRAAVTQQLKDVGNGKVYVLTTGSTHPFEVAVINDIKSIMSSGQLANRPQVVYQRYSQRDINEFAGHLNPEEEVVIIVPSVEEAKVSRMLTNLGLVSERAKAKITVWGYSEWLRFQTFETDDLHKLNTTIYSSYGVDYSSELAKSFSTNYREWYQTEPVSFNPYFQKVGTTSGYSRYGMWGYDVMFYFVGAVKNYGQHFQKCLDGYNPNLLQTNFRFTHITNWGGAYNSGLVKVHFNRNYHTVVVPAI